MILWRIPKPFSGEITMSHNQETIALILQELKQEVRSQRLQSKPKQSAALASAFKQVRLTSWVNPHQSIAWPRWPEGLWPKAVALAQKVTRRLLCWYINPIIDEQNHFNAAVERTLSVLIEENARLRTELLFLAATQLERSDWENS
jgi:hypothetical protein